VGPRRTTDALRILEHEFGSAPGWQEDVARERERLNVAQVIYDARTSAGLTQRQLAELIGTRQSVISRLEDADYAGHSLQMLERIARALDLELRVEMVSRVARPEPATGPVG
jgi:ribosome-binding protein aMBF1 (putative translation factor)